MNKTGKLLGAAGAGAMALIVAEAGTVGATSVGQQGPQRDTFRGGIGADFCERSVVTSTNNRPDFRGWNMIRGWNSGCNGPPVISTPDQGIVVDAIVNGSVCSSNFFAANQSNSGVADFKGGFLCGSLVSGYSYKTRSTGLWLTDNHPSWLTIGPVDSGYK